MSTRWYDDERDPDAQYRNDEPAWVEPVAIFGAALLLACFWFSAPVVFGALWAALKGLGR